jgi:hypothetical protein
LRGTPNQRVKGKHLGQKLWRNGFLQNILDGQIGVLVFKLFDDFQIFIVSSSFQRLYQMGRCGKRTETRAALEQAQAHKSADYPPSLQAGVLHPKPEHA